MSALTHHALSYSERAELTSNPATKELFSLIDRKKTNLSVSVDVESCCQLLKIAEAIGPEISMLKFHVEILRDFSWSFVERLQHLAAEQDFQVVSDSKIGDIGNTAKRIYSGGLYRMVEWSDMVTAHPAPGPGILSALSEVGSEKGRGVLLVAEMSTRGTLATGSYTEAALEMALESPDSVAGFVCQHRLTTDPRFIHFTPGVSLQQSSDQMDQQFRHPRDLVREFSDVIAVGRGVYQAKNPQLAAAQYREEAWQGYLERLQA